MLDVDALDELYRERLLEPYGIGVPAAYLFAGVLLYVAAAPGLASFRVQNRYAQLGIIVIVAVATVAILLAGYDYRRLDSTRWKLTWERDGPGAEVDE